MKTIFVAQGFIALMTMIIISSVLLVTTLSLAQFGLTHRYFILDLEHKDMSAHVAEACVHIARIMVMNTPTDPITLPLTFPVHHELCTIESITQSRTTSTIQTRGTSGEIETHYLVTVDYRNGNFLSWQEVINP